jgi:hypothetical protein
VAKKEKSSVGLIVGLVLVSVAALGFVLFRSFSGPSYTQVPTSKELHSRAEKLALKSGGDFASLSPAEQKVLDDITMGRGKKYVEINYKRLSASGGK